MVFLRADSHLTMSVSSCRTAATVEAVTGRSGQPVRRLAPCRRRLFRAAALTLSLAVSLAAAEIALRLLGLGYGHAPIVGHDVFHHWHPTGYTTREWSRWGEYASFASHYNTDGMAMREELPPPEAASLVFLGDSFTEAVQVPEHQRFATMVGRRLAMPALNFGCSSFCPLLSRLQLEHFASRIAPRAVVLQLYANDIDGQRQYSAAAVRDQAGRIVAVRGDRTPLMVRLARRCYLARLGYKGWQTARFWWKSRRQRGGYAPRDLWSPVFIQPVQEAYSDDDLAAFEASLSDVADVCRRRNCPLLLMVIPDRGARLHNQPDYFYDYVATLARRDGLPLIDLAGEFAAHDVESLFFRRDSHLNARGHEVAAEAVAVALQHYCAAQP